MTYNQFMTRTTIRIEPNTLKEAKKIALEREVSLQKVVNWGLELLVFYEKKNDKKRKLTIDDFPSHDFGVDLSSLKIDRDFIYGDPKI